MAKRRTVRVEIETSPRDFVMARLAAARASAEAAIQAIDDAVTLFVNPQDDKKGKERAELVESALEALGCATRAAESAEEVLGQVDPLEIEPWDDDGDDDDEDEGDGEDEDDEDTDEDDDAQDDD